LRVIGLLLVTLGIVAVTLAMRGIVPAMLRLLSLFFAKEGLRQAARAVEDAGDVAADAMRSFRGWLRDPPSRSADSGAGDPGRAAEPGETRGTEDARIRVAPAPAPAPAPQGSAGPGARVDTADRGPTSRGEDDESDEDHESSLRRAR
jgi:hypothetical protein